MRGGARAARLLESQLHAPTRPTALHCRFDQLDHIARFLRGDRRTALIEAGAVRLRPIMMTTLAMIFGMLPMAIGVGQGGEMLAPMGRAVIGGVITSTILTLLVVPVLYTYLYALSAKLKSFWHKGAPEPKEQPAA